MGWDGQSLRCFLQQKDTHLTLSLRLSSFSDIYQNTKILIFCATKHRKKSILEYISYVSPQTREDLQCVIINIIMCKQIATNAKRVSTLTQCWLHRWIPFSNHLHTYKFSLSPTDFKSIHMQFSFELLKLQFWKNIYWTRRSYFYFCEIFLGDTDCFKQII